MKKILTVLLSVLLVVMPIVNVDAKTTTTTKKAGEKVNFYIFYVSTCGYCKALHEYTAKLEENPDFNYMFNIVDFEVWGNSDNANLMQDVAKEFNVQANGVPFYVIGEEYFTVYAESYQTKIEAAIKKAYNDANTKDMVSTLESYKNATKTTSEAKKAEEKATKTKNYGAYIVLGLTTVIIIGIIIVRSKEA